MGVARALLGPLVLCLCACLQDGMGARVAAPRRGASAVRAPHRPNVRLASSESYDVLVHGATSGGVAAAVASGRQGAKTALVCAEWPSCFDEGGRRVGGMSSGGLGQTDLGRSEPQVELAGEVTVRVEIPVSETDTVSCLSGGIVREFYERNRDFYTKEYGLLDDPALCRLPHDKCAVTYNVEPETALAAFEAMIASAGVEVLYGAEIVRVEKDAAAATLQAVYYNASADVLGQGSAVRRIAATAFVDASYEGDLLSLANVSYRTDREGAAEYNESLAGVQEGNNGHEFETFVSPLDSESGELLPGVRDGHLSAPGSEDGRQQAYNFRLCVTNDTSRVAWTEPTGYDPSEWELLRRYLKSCAFDGSGASQVRACWRRAQKPGLPIPAMKCRETPEPWYQTEWFLQLLI